MTKQAPKLKKGRRVPKYNPDNSVHGDAWGYTWICLKCGKEFISRRTAEIHVNSNCEKDLFRKEVIDLIETKAFRMAKLSHDKEMVDIFDKTVEEILVISFDGFKKLPKDEGRIRYYGTCGSYSEVRINKEEE